MPTNGCSVLGKAPPFDQLASAAYSIPGKTIVCVSRLRLEAAAVELLPATCGMEINGFEDGTHTIALGDRKTVPYARGVE